MDIICFKTKHAVPKLSRSVIEDFFYICYVMPISTDGIGIF